MMMIEKKLNPPNTNPKSFVNNACFHSIHTIITAASNSCLYLSVLLLLLLLLLIEIMVHQFSQQHLVLAPSREMNISELLQEQ
jgi:hypothetical protein